MTLGVWIRLQRESKGWSQAELARQMKIAQPHISRLEQDQRRPTPELITALANVFGVPVYEVVRQAWPEAVATLEDLRADELHSEFLQEIARLQHLLSPTQQAALLATAHAMVDPAPP